MIISPADNTRGGSLQGMPPFFIYIFAVEKYIISI